MDAFSSVAIANTSLRPYFGAIMQAGVQNPDRVTDLMSFLPITSQGVPTFVATPTADCTLMGTPAANRRYVGAQMANGAFGVATLVYASRDGEHDSCFNPLRSTLLSPDLRPTQCISAPPSTATLTPVRTPTLSP